MKPDAKIETLLKAKGRAVISIEPAASVYEAIALMAQHRVGALLVMDGERLAGIISERDYARKVILEGRSSRETRVEEVMTREVITAKLDDTVEGAMRVVSEHRIRHLPVLDQERVVGVISIGDLVKWIISAQEQIIEQMASYISGGYPG